MRKTLKINLILVLSLVIVLSGCTKNKGSEPSASQSPSAAASQPASETQSASETQQAETESESNSALPIVSSPLTIKMFAGVPAPVKPEYDQLMLWQEFEKMSNIHIDWENVPYGTAYERLPLMLNSGDYPEIIYGYYFPPADLIKYGSAGIFKPLNDLIPKYAPNLNAFLEKHPEIRKGMTMPDGNIYGLPTIVDPEYTEQLTSIKMWFKEDWLKQLNMNVPTTLDEFYQVLKAFKENDLNGNGKQDEVPFMVDGGYDYLIFVLSGSFGLMNHGTGNVDIDPQTNKLRFVKTDPRYREVLQFLNKLYTEGIMGEELFALNTEQFLAKAGEGVVGSFLGLGESQFRGSGYVGGEVMAGPHGDRLWPYVLAPLNTSGGFVLTDKVKNPEEALRWADYFYSDEGIKMYFMGFDGVTYKQNADGSYSYTDNIAKNPDGLSIPQAIGQYLVYPGTIFPSILKKDYYPEDPAVRAKSEAATEKIKPYLPTEVWPEFSFTQEEADEMSTIATDMFTFIAEQQGDFVRGKLELNDENWNKYVKTINDMGLDRYMELYQASYDRYSKS